MSATPRPPLLKRVPPGVWMALIWCGLTAYAFVRPQNGPQPIPVAGVPSDPVTSLLAMAVVLVLPAALLRRRPLPALALLLAGSLVETLTLHSRQVALL